MMYICAKLVASSVSPYSSPTPSPLEFGLCLESGKRIMVRVVFFLISNNMSLCLLATT